MRATIEAHRGLRLVRPDGYIVNALTGRAIERAGDVRLSEGKLFAGSLEVGVFYRSDEQRLFPVTPDLARDPEAQAVFELSLDRMMIGRVLDGAEHAIATTILTVGRLIEDPVRTVEEAVTAFGEIGALITSSPELCERFLAMPLNDQIEALSNVLMTLALAKGVAGFGKGAVSAGGTALGNAGSVAINVMRGEAAAAWWLQLDFAAAAAAAGRGGLSMLAPLTVSPLLSTADDSAKGPASSLPELSEKAQASMKRVSKVLSEDVAAAKTKALPRLAAERERLIAKLDDLLADENLSERSRVAIERARNALNDHTKPEDLTGALRDNLEMPVRKSGSGREWTHKREVENAIQSLSEARKSLAYEFQRGIRTGDVTADLSKLGDDLLDFRRAVEAFIKPGS